MLLLFRYILLLCTCNVLKIKIYCVIFFRWKQSINENNVAALSQFSKEAIDYINGLRICKISRGKTKHLINQQVIHSQSKAGFVGFKIVLSNIVDMYNSVKDLPSVIQNGFCTYDILQDHIEFLFGVARRRTGNNHNPSILELRAAFRKIVAEGGFQCVITSKKGNCIPLGIPRLLPVRIFENIY